MYSMSKRISDRKPPLAKTPMRPCRVLRSSNSSSMQTPPGSLTKTQKPRRPWDLEESELRPEYRTISCELRTLAKMVRNGLGNGDVDDPKAKVADSCSLKSSPLFARGRFYNEYSARRNERLKSKKGAAGDDGKTTVYSLCVSVESSKRSSSRKLESLRKSVSAAYSVDRNETPRYMLRSMSKENKKPPLPANFEKSVIGGEKKIGARRSRRI
ncbi:FACT complex subunit like [Quillaja saponaria]|uniref:FACT complex subunit like n=1 Tax=Quillaja saponaria TaxID=32244 RepID=A0AAD7LH05_QUISA|nr:FACT complex subunit like [Quillaja saponaria]